MQHRSANPDPPGSPEAVNRNRTTLPAQDTMPVGFCVIDRDLRLVGMNRRMSEMIGQPGEDQPGRSLAEVTPEIAARFELPLRRALRGERVGNLELRGVRAGTSHTGRVLQVALEPIRRQDGEVTAVLCSALDVTACGPGGRPPRGGEARLPDLIEQAVFGICQTDLQGRILLANNRFCEIVGRGREALLGSLMQDITLPEDLPSNLALFERLVATGEPFTIEKRYLRPDGSVVWVRNDVSAIRDPCSRPCSLMAVIQDITERKRAEEARRESEKRLARAIAAARMSTWEWDPASGALHVSAGFDEFFARPDGSIRSMEALLEAMHPEDRSNVEAVLARALVSMEDRDQAVEFRVRAADGTERWLRAQGRAERDADGRPLRLLGITHDVTRQRQAEQQIAYLAYHDPLTDLANRRLFHQRLALALEGARGEERLALHWIDLNQFKDVNDSLGHPAGDALLRDAADRLRGCVRKGDIVARLGGDEFAIVQTGLRGADEAAGLARRVIAVLGEDYEIEGQRVNTGASIGIALAPGDGATPDELVRKADIALYRAKAEGRAGFRFFERGMEQSLRRKQELKLGLRRALARKELDLHFQPLLGLRDRAVTCLEALVRWQHPARGLISPAEFVPVAEETGLIGPLGEWALRTACREAVRWPLPIRLAVNLSPVQFRNPDLLSMVKAALQESGLAAERLELEITESVLLQDDEANFAILHELRALGVRIALDDFGTGFSSLGYLLRFPFNKIKIDRSFVLGLPEREESRAIVGAVASMGRNLGMTIAAEGVETAGQADVLRRMGCHEVQGYLFSRPVRAGEVAALIDRLRRAKDPVA